MIEKLENHVQKFKKMSVYKLIKKYPGSPFVGTIARDMGSRYNFLYSGSCIGYTQNIKEKQEIEKFSEFWQKYFLKTEDNIYKFIGDEVYVIYRRAKNDKWDFISQNAEKITSDWIRPTHENIKDFHSKESAFIFMNKENKKIDDIINNSKPIFSVNDLKELFNFEFIDKEKYNKFVSEKLGKLQ